MQNKEIKEKQKTIRTYEINGDICELNITCKYGTFTTIIDSNDYERIKDFAWNIRKNHEKWYVYYTQNKPKKMVHLHRVINNTPDGFITDHINRNPLDNRKSNLRTCTNAENRLNLSKFKTNKSGHAGIHWQDNRWRVDIWENGKIKYLGMYKDYKEALNIRLKAERESKRYELQGM